LYTKARDAFVAKYTSDGNFVWVRQAGAPETGHSDIASGVAIDPFGNVIVAGLIGEGKATFGNITLTSAGESDIFMAKYDGDGNIIWAKNIGGPNRDVANDFVLDAVGNIYITGYFTGTVDFGGETLVGTDFLEIFVAKYDNNGILLWVQGATGIGRDRARGITKDTSGNIFIIGEFESNADFPAMTLTSIGDSDIFIAKYDSDGNFQWAERAGGIGYDVGWRVTLDDSGIGYISGEFSETANFGSLTLTSNGGRDGFLASFGPSLSNQPPVSNAGENIAISSENQIITVIQGTASDPDNDSLTYRWLEGENEFSTWQNVGTNGEAYLNLSTVPYFAIGQHTLTLEVSDSQSIATDSMILTIDNSAPHAAPTGGGVYEIFTPVTLGGGVSDFDGDLLTFE